MERTRRYLTDGDMARLLRMSTRIFRCIVGGFVRGGHHLTHTTVGREVNLVDAQPETVDGRRRWDVRRVAMVLDVDESDVAAYVGMGVAEPPREKPKKRNPSRWGEPTVVYSMTGAFADSAY